MYPPLNIDFWSFLMSSCNNRGAPPGTYRRTRIREVSYKPLRLFIEYDIQNKKKFKTFFTHEEYFHQLASGRILKTFYLYNVSLHHLYFRIQHLGLSPYNT